MALLNRASFVEVASNVALNSFKQSLDDVLLKEARTFKSKNIAMTAPTHPPFPRMNTAGAVILSIVVLGVFSTTAW